MRIRYPLCSFLFFATATLAQAPAGAHGQEGPPAAGSVLRRSFGAFAIAGETATAGPDYAARFVGSGIEFTPALGERAPQRLPVSFTLESIRRGTHTIVAPDTVAPDRDGNFVRYPRGKGIVESYEARVDGVEQTFRFAERPAGTGDLVVRGKVTTELEARSVEASGAIRFETKGLGGVSWGAVTGVDAGGRRVAGSLRLDGDHLELSLPGGFVDEAAYPLLLDPLIGAIVVATGAGNEHSPDVAYDQSNDRYLVAWHVRYSSTNRAVFAQRLSSTGTLVGSLIGLGPTNANDHTPRVANVNAANRFLVVNVSRQWQGGTAGWGDVVQWRAINASDGASTPVQQVFAGGPDTVRLDVGGNSSTLTSTTCVVMQTATWLGMFRIQVPSAGDPVVMVGDTLDAGGAVAAAICNHCGTAGRFLVVWQVRTPNGMHDVYGRVVDVNGTLVGPARPIAANIVVDEAAPACATRDGVEFAIVYELRVSGPTGNSDIACRTATISSSGVLQVGAERVIAGSLLQDAVSPAIDFAAAKYIAVWSSFANLGGARNIYMMGLDPRSCAPCEQATAIDTSAATADWYPRIAAKYSGAQTTNDEAFVVWESIEASSDVKVQRVQAIGSGGSVTVLGGGCGAGTTAVNGPVALGNASFAFTLTGTATPAIGLILGLGTVNLACGPCTQVPRADFVHIGAGPYQLPIPCNTGLIGAPLYAQWMLLAPGGCPMAPSLATTQAVRAVVGV